MVTLTPKFPLYVIADLHLGGGSAATEKLFNAFLETLKAEDSSLLILGDFFEVWVGDDVRSPLTQQVAARLKQLSQTGTAIYFVHGNRDFLLGADYAKEAGMRLLEEPVMISGALPPIGFVHGDCLCTADEKFQAFREKSRSSTWQKRILRLPSFLRQILGKWARWRSANHGKRTITTHPTIADVSPQEVTRFMRQHGMKKLVHGHTHRLAIHQEPAGPETQRWVLGDWHNDSGSVMLITPSNTSMHTIKLTPSGEVKWSAPVQPLAH
ncbi:MAG TPA: UDP-2,3-diacylglucosamine diphosphatase [Wenzhouxiangella sp.]